MLVPITHIKETHMSTLTVAFDNYNNEYILSTIQLAYEDKMTVLDDVKFYKFNKSKHRIIKRIYDINIGKLSKTHGLYSIKFIDQSKCNSLNPMALILHEDQLELDYRPNQYVLSFLGM